MQANAADFNFVGQANLGALFQLDSGRLAETMGAGAAMQGGLPIVVDGEAIGAVGASFDTPEHDVQIAQARLAAVPH